MASSEHVVISKKDLALLAEWMRVEAYTAEDQYDAMMRPGMWQEELKQAKADRGVS